MGELLLSEQGGSYLFKLIGQLLERKKKVVTLLLHINKYAT